MRLVFIIFKNKVIAEVLTIVKINETEGQSQVKFALKAEVWQVILVRLKVLWTSRVKIVEHNFNTKRSQVVNQKREAHAAFYTVFNLLTQHHSVLSSEQE